jgi:adenylate cyclase
VTDQRAPRADPPAFLTADELAMRTGTPRERIIELTERGVIPVEAPDHYAPGDVHRIRLVGAFESEGITIDALVAAAEQGRISFAYYDELHPPPGPIAPHTYGEFKTSLGRLGELLPSLYVAFGLAEPNPTARLEADEEAFLGRLLGNMDRTGMPDAANRIVRLFGEANRRAAEGSLGVYEDVLAQLGEVIALTGIPPREEYERVLQPWAQLARLAPELAAFLATKHLSRTIDAFSSETTERVLEETGFVAERQVVYPGVAFVDLTGFTRLSEERGDQAAAGVSLELGELARTTAEAHGGRVVKLLGDGVLLRLPDALTAVDATVELVQALPGAGLPSGHAGVHSGPLIEREGDVFGRSVNLAARVSDIAPAGQVYVTSAIADAIEGSPHRLEPVAPANLQGIGEVSLFRVVAE